MAVAAGKSNVDARAIAKEAYHRAKLVRVTAPCGFGARAGGHSRACIHELFAGCVHFPATDR
eukprot:7991000-Pyramimonas_sp.AAC.1